MPAPETPDTRTRDLGTDAQAVDADTVTGMGSFSQVHRSDGLLPVDAGRVVVPGLGFAWYAGG